MSGGVGASRAVLRKRRRKAKKDDNRAERRKAPPRQQADDDDGEGDDKRNANASTSSPANPSPVVMQKRKRKTKKDSDDKQNAKSSTSSPASSVAPPSVTVLPWECSRSDHCETPPEAVNDATRLIDAMALGGAVPTSRDSVRVYDPYFCQGASRRHLVALGFSSDNVKHEPVDCYAEWARLDGLPACDVLVTNPPFSGTHAERLFRHLHRLQTKGQCPSFLVLLPNYVYTKTFYKELYLFDDAAMRAADARRGKKAQSTARTENTPAPCCLFAPASRYAFWSPVRNAGTEEKEGKKRRHSRADLGYRSMPYHCFWYAYMRPKAGEASSAAQARLIDAWRKVRGEEGGNLVAHYGHLPNSLKDEWDPTRVSRM